MRTGLTGARERGERSGVGHSPRGSRSDLQALAQSHLSHHRYLDAARLCDLYVKLYQTDAAILSVLTLTHYALGKYEATHRTAHQWAQASPSDAAAHYYLALAELHCGHPAEASRRLLLASRLSNAGQDLIERCIQALCDLDAIQIRQIRALLETDPAFALTFQRNPDLALEAAGFVLSPLALDSLETLTDSSPRPNYRSGHA